jgi:Ni/Co efflux regulator RcnB
MKKSLAMLVAAALTLPLVPAAAQNHNSDNHPSQQARPGDRGPDNRAHDDRGRDDHRGQKAHRFAKGEKFSRGRATNYARINYREHRRLGAPPRGYTWVRSGDDALLVRLSNNLISRVVLDVY